MTKRILIVEDDESVGFLEEMIVEAAGYEVHLLRNAHEVKNELRKWKPDLIIMDVMMPKKSGIEAVKELGEDPDLREVPVLFVSVVNLPAQFPKALQRDNVAFLQKPFAMEDLMEQICNLCGRSRSE
jgi:DNA-binding response OmpR family regulator